MHHWHRAAPLHDDSFQPLSQRATMRGILSMSLLKHNGVAASMAPIKMNANSMNPPVPPKYRMAPHPYTYLSSSGVRVTHPAAPASILRSAVGAGTCTALPPACGWAGGLRCKEVETGAACTS